MNVKLLNDDYVLMPHQPDWSVTPRYRRRWLTQTTEALRGGEERLALRGDPWTELSWQIDCWTHNERARLEERIRAAKKTGLALAPRWGRADKLSAPASGSTVTVAGGVAWQEFDYIYFVRPTQRPYDDHELRVITAVNGNTLTLDQALEETYPDRTLVWPMIGGKFTCRDISHWSDRTAAVSVTLLNMGEHLLGTPTAPARECEEGEIIEDFVEYELGPLSTFNGGCGWDGDGVIQLPHARTVSLETFDTYPLGAADDSTMTDGTGWDGPPTIHQY